MGPARPAALALAERLHAAEGGRLRRFFLGRLRSADAAQDATQETFLRMLRVPSAEEIAEPRAYLFQVARSVAASAHRRAAREAEHAAGAVPEELASPEPGPERRLADREALLLMARAIEGLPNRCQQVFILSRLHGLPNGEIAARLGISRNMVEKHIVRALIDCRRARREAGMW